MTKLEQLVLDVCEITGTSEVRIQQMLDKILDDHLTKDLISDWKDISKTEQVEIGVTFAGRYNLSKFLILMDSLSNMKEELV